MLVASTDPQDPLSYLSDPGHCEGPVSLHKLLVRCMGLCCVLDWRRNASKASKMFFDEILRRELFLQKKGNPNLLLITWSQVTLGLQN